MGEMMPSVFIMATGGRLLEQQVFIERSIYAQ